MEVKPLYVFSSRKVHLPGELLKPLHATPFCVYCFFLRRVHRGSTGSIPPPPAADGPHSRTRGPRHFLALLPGHSLRGAPPGLPGVLAGYHCLADLRVVLSLKWDVGDVEGEILEVRVGGRGGSSGGVFGSVLKNVGYEYHSWGSKRNRQLDEYRLFGGNVIRHLTSANAARKKLH